MFAAVWGEPVSDLGFVCTVITEMLFSCFEKLPRGKWISSWLWGGKNKVPSASNPDLLVLGRIVYRRQAWEGRSMCWEEKQGRFFQYRCEPGSVTACLLWFQWRNTQCSIWMAVVSHVLIEMHFLPCNVCPCRAASAEVGRWRGAINFVSSEKQCPVDSDMITSSFSACAFVTDQVLLPLNVITLKEAVFDSRLLHCARAVQTSCRNPSSVAEIQKCC